MENKGIKPTDASKLLALIFGSLDKQKKSKSIKLSDIEERLDAEQSRLVIAYEYITVLEKWKSYKDREMLSMNCSTINENPYEMNEAYMKTLIEELNEQMIHQYIYNAGWNAALEKLKQDKRLKRHEKYLRERL